MICKNPKSGHPHMLPSDCSEHIVAKDKISVDPPSPDQLLKKSPAR